MTDLKLSYNPNPICPYCGHAERDAWEIDFGSGMEGDAVITCEHCETDYRVHREVEITYSSEKIEVRQ